MLACRIKEKCCNVVCELIKLPQHITCIYIVLYSLASFVCLAILARIILPTAKGIKMHQEDDAVIHSNVQLAAAEMSECRPHMAPRCHA